ncbi:MAG: MBL fold metallo-hydrolase [Ferruginibacter sp.]
MLRNRVTGKIYFLCRSMALFTASLNSGSNGNCYYVGNDRDAVLIDAGLSCRETEKRMRAIGLSMQTVRAIVISHEHTDHIKGMQVLAEKYDLPVYINNLTLKHSNSRFRKSLCCHFTSSEPIIVGDLHIKAFGKFHDAADPHSFIVSYEGINVGVFTDLGIACDNLVHHFKQCHAAYLEANYDKILLENGRYPIHLKNRIRGGHGHLSNEQALRLFCDHRPGFMSHLFLAHLSKDNNDPELVLELFNKHKGNVVVEVASRYRPTAVYRIVNENTGSGTVHGIVSLRPEQLTLF